MQAALSATETALAATEVQLTADNQLAEADMYHAQRALLSESALHDRAVELIAHEGWLAADAIIQAGDEWIRTLEASDQPAPELRPGTIRLLTGQVWRILATDTSLADRLQEPSILVADDLGPAELMRLPRDKILGLVLSRSGLTAHTSILMRAWSIPTVVGMDEHILYQVADGTLLALNGTSGEIVIEPDADTAAHLRGVADELAYRRQEMRNQRDHVSVTRDGKHINLLANVSSFTGAQAAHEWGAGGIGSLRTELLFSGCSTMPTEDEQVSMYLGVANELPNVPIVARTLDMGGDKRLPIFPLPREDNPFLGWRGIRIGLSRVDELLMPQLRAMLRAAAHADLRIIAPMISTLQEWRQLRGLFEQAHRDLLAAGIPCAARPQLGVLIEVPAAALIIDQLAREADFISIGSNDLTQYTLACDRTNPRVAHLYQPLEPVMLRLFHTIATAAHLHGRTVSLCGELASDARVTALLVGLGIDELSCTPPALPAVRAAVRDTSAAEAEHLAHVALACSTLDEVRDLL